MEKKLVGDGHNANMPMHYAAIFKGCKNDDI